MVVICCNFFVRKKDPVTFDQALTHPMRPMHIHWKDSMLTTVNYTSSSCTGSFSGEMALAVVERTVNESKVLDIPLFFTPIHAHVMSPVMMSLFCSMMNTYLGLRFESQYLFLKFPSLSYSNYNIY